MRDFRDAKAMAQTLRAALAAMGFTITVSQSLELIAQAFGVTDWNTLSAAIRAQPAGGPESTSRSAPAAEGTKTPGEPAISLPANPLSGELESALKQVFVFAKGRKHEEATVEHLLRFLLDDADVSGVMKACGVNLDDLRKRLADYIAHLKSQPTDGGDGPRPTPGFQRVLQRAVFHVHQAGRYPVKTLNVLIAIFSEKDSHAVKLLDEQGVTRMDVVDYMTHGIIKGGGDAASSPTPR
jgi:hypothetical protein